MPRGANNLARGVPFMLKSILVPLDGSAFAEEALPTALAIAAREGARLELVIAHEVLPAYRVQGAPPRDSRLDNEIREERSRYVDALADWARRSTSVPVTATLVAGPIVTTLAEHIGTRVDLVVMTTHGGTQSHLARERRRRPGAPRGRPGAGDPARRIRGAYAAPALLCANPSPAGWLAVRGGCD